MPKTTKSTTTSTTLIKATGINRFYANTHAVKDLEFELHAGDILGFLGPNGAGKSTSMQIISGSLAPDAGQIEINGIDLIEQPTLAKQQLGYLPEQPPLYKELTVDEYLHYSAKLRNLKKDSIKSATEKSKQRCGLSKVCNKLISNLSKGYQQRVGIAQAIIHNPAVIILDEPTVGLDPIQIKEIRQLIIELGKDHGVILSTHILPEVLAVCNRVQIIQQGRLVYHSDMSTITENMKSSKIDLSFKNNIDIELIKNISNISHVEATANNSVCIEVCENESAAEQALNSLLTIALEKNWSLISMTPRVRTLEQIFIELTVNNDPQPSAENSDTGKTS